MISKFHKLTMGQIPIIGSGGISSSKDILRMGRAGATLVQIYTGMGYQGPGFVSNLKFELKEELKKLDTDWEGFRNGKVSKT